MHHEIASRAASGYSTPGLDPVSDALFSVVLLAALLAIACTVLRLVRRTSPFRSSPSTTDPRGAR